MRKDELHEIFRKHLKKINPETHGLDDLVYEVVGEYMAVLLSQGNIPQYMMDTVETDLREEVIEMYRKTTYGFLNLKEYLQTIKNKTSKRVS
jgi:hypothetical protein